MIDKIKRNTLKRIGAGAVAATTAGIASTAFARSGSSAYPDDTAGGASAQTEPANIEVHTRISAVTNDLEILITNSGRSNTTILQITPSVTSTKRGQFDFAELMKQGDITLAPGQSLSVPMRPHTHVLNAADTSGQQAENLTAALRRAFSVTTDNDMFAKVHVHDGMRFI